MPDLVLYNTLTKKKEVFKPLKKKKVGLYTCGPTVYDYAHIGNLRTYIFEDILKRVLVYDGYKVKHIENITDVGHLVSDADDGEDKMMKALRREGLKPTAKSLLKLATLYAKAFKKDITDLNILPPEKWVKATNHVKEMIKLIKKIEKNGYAYETDDGLYFDTTKLKDYGQIANFDNVQLKAGARVEVNPEKRNPHDFALWIKAVGENKNHVMQWPSPWGVGFPGWHIECSAMSIKYLGVPFDIHCGGIDHIPVHHTNEIAQNQAATGSPGARWWLHGEFLVVDSNRMGKSEGNLITLKTLIDKGFDPLAYRYFCLQTHYRQKLNLSWEAIAAAQTAYRNLKDIVAGFGRSRVGAKQYEEQFELSLNNDLNLPQALAVVWNMVGDTAISSGAKKQSLLKFDQVLGLNLSKVKKVKIPRKIMLLAQDRQRARKAKEWAKADTLRQQIEREGYTIEDTKDGFIIKPQ